MRTSDDRLLTTHCGSLPRQTEQLSDLLLEQELGHPIDEAELARQVEAGIDGVIREQICAGIDIISDGEQSRPGFSTYITRRMDGFGGVSRRPVPRDIEEFPHFASLRQKKVTKQTRIGNAPQAVGDVIYHGAAEAKADCDRLAAALRRAGRPPDDGFVCSVSPGIVATTMLNAHYDTQENYLFALASELSKEY